MIRESSRKPKLEYCWDVPGVKPSHLVSSHLTSVLLSGAESKWNCLIMSWDENMGSPWPVVNPPLCRRSCSTVMRNILLSRMAFEKVESFSIPRGPNTVSCRDSSPSSFSFMIPVAVISFETDAILSILPGLILTLSSASAHPYPLA